MTKSILELPYEPFAISFTSSYSPRCILGVGSYEVKNSNCFDLFVFDDNYTTKIEPPKEANFKFPINSMKFSPNLASEETEFLLTGSDTVKLWIIHDSNKVELSSEYEINKTCNPVTAVDWCQSQKTLAIASSTDNFVYVFDFMADCISSSVMAHDNPIHDCCFCGNDSNLFVTAGFDGSMRLIDIRDLTSMILVYQASMPLLRCAVSTLDPNLIALFGRSSTGIALVDIRRPGLPVAASTHVDKEVTGISWSVSKNEEDGNLLFSINSSGQLRACDFMSGKTMSPSTILYETDKMFQSLSIWKDMAAISYDKSIEIVNISKQHSDSSILG